METTDQQLSGLKNKFYLLDEDHDGYINKTQLEAFMKD